MSDPQARAYDFVTQQQDAVYCEISSVKKPGLNFRAKLPGRPSTSYQKIN